MWLVKRVIRAEDAPVIGSMLPVGNDLCSLLCLHAHAILWPSYLRAKGKQILANSLQIKPSIQCSVLLPGPRDKHRRREGERLSLVSRCQICLIIYSAFFAHWHR